MNPRGTPDGRRAVSFSAALALPPAAAGGVDTDRDGIPDRWESAQRLDAHWTPDAKADPRLRRRANLRKYRLRLRPHDADSDDDGRRDGRLDSDGATVCRTAGRSPSGCARGSSTVSGDLDRDRLTNVREWAKRGLPRDEDSDDGGQDDGDELRTGTDVDDRDGPRRRPRRRGRARPARHGRSSDAGTGTWCWRW